MNNDSLNQLLIVGITPYFLEKSGVWFTENLQEILSARHSQQFFEDNIIFLSLTNSGVNEEAKKSPAKENSPMLVRDKQKDHCIQFAQFLRKLDEMGYEKVFKVTDPGEFSQRGGIIDVFPINLMNAVRLDFLGNEVDSIKILEDINPVRNTARASAPEGPVGRAVSNGVKIKNDSATKDVWWKKSREILKKRLKSQKLFSELKGLKPGDYLVHLDHGVARFTGIENFHLTPADGFPGGFFSISNFHSISNDQISKSENRYYVLEYDKDDKLYVPVGLERKLSRYVGFQDPKVSRLGSNLWQKTKRKIKEDVEKLAKELLQLYAQKEITERTPYIEDEELESQFKSGFAFQETPDQLQAIEDIENDLSKTKPMDRIVCGDVGFGKTEVAMRTALLALTNNRQTALICPTTILANQHFNSFKKRFEKIPIRIAQLSGLQTKTEQKKIIEDLKQGKVDIIIGTHRLLSKDVEFKNLQLLIIDDEQKFGVKQKEKLRGMKTSLDVLSLSATPIPRTIYLALSAFKNISLMQTPPAGRQAITTKIMVYNDKTVKEIINAELKRKGQVYFLHNRVQTIEAKSQELKELCPKAKFGIVHGRIPEKKLIKIMDDFQKERTNVLVATTIIENGLDLPNVNTIIIEDATRLGLSQAHQIRGRVGRSSTKSFAYFMYPVRNTARAGAPEGSGVPPGSRAVSNGVYDEKFLTPLANPVRKTEQSWTPDLSDKKLLEKYSDHSYRGISKKEIPRYGLSNGAKERLRALEDAQELGAGYRIAIRDLELRGAGNILGREQSGAINKIGLNLYSQILAEAVEKFK